MPSRRTRTLALSAAVLLYVAASAWYLASRPSYLTVVVCDVGQGDAILIRTPGGQDVLVDGGRTDGAVLSCLGRYLPPWDRTVELVILSHGDSDHVGGLPLVAQRYRIGRALSNGVESDSQVYRAWRESLRLRGVEQQTVGAGDTLDFGDGVSAAVVWPGPAADRTNTNESSVVVRLAYGSCTALLTGDIAAETELAILASGADVSAQLLKVAHHGSRYSSDAAFLAAVGAELAAVSVGENSYGHPGQQTLGRLAAAGAAVLRTDLSGDLVFRGDGRGWSLKQPLLAW